MAAKILFVEDEPLARQLFCQVLRDEGYLVMEAGDGAEALDLLQTQHVDLVISDFMMPKMQGTRLVEHLHSFHPGIPVMLITRLFVRGFREGRFAGGRRGHAEAH